MWFLSGLFSQEGSFYSFTVLPLSGLFFFYFFCLFCFLLVFVFSSFQVFTVSSSFVFLSLVGFCSPVFVASLARFLPSLFCFILWCVSFRTLRYLCCLV